MKKLLALALSVMLLLSVAVCAQGMETTGAAAPSPAQAPREGLNKDIYVDREWSILNAKHDREVTITMWIPNSATSTMGTACPPSRSTRPGRWICVRCSPMRSCSSSPRV